jgi:hypothetical protein
MQLAVQGGAEMEARIEDTGTGRLNNRKRQREAIRSYLLITF